MGIDSNLLAKKLVLYVASLARACNERYALKTELPLFCEENVDDLDS